MVQNLAAVGIVIAAVGTVVMALVAAATTTEGYTATAGIRG